MLLLPDSTFNDSANELVKGGRVSGHSCKYCGYQARGAGTAEVLRDLVDHIKQTGHSRKNVADADELAAMRQRTEEQKRTAKQERGSGHGRRLIFPGLGVAVRDGLVYRWNLIEGHLLGELTGAQAEITDPTKAQMIRAGLASGATLGALIGPVALLPGVLRKSKAVAFVSFVDGIVHERKLDGNMAIRSAQRDAVKFNAMVAASQPAQEPQSPAAPRAATDRLAEVTCMHDDGLLTDEEYQAKRAEIIGEI